MKFYLRSSNVMTTSFSLSSTTFTHYQGGNINSLEVEVDDGVIEELVFSEAAIVVCVDGDASLERWGRVHQKPKHNIKLINTSLNSVGVC